MIVFSFNMLTALPVSSYSDDDNTGATIGAMVGGIVGIILIALLISVILWCYCKQCKKKTKSGMLKNVKIH